MKILYESDKGNLTPNKLWIQADRIVAISERLLNVTNSAIFKNCLDHF